MKTFLISICLLLMILPEIHCQNKKNFEKKRSIQFNERASYIEVNDKYQRYLDTIFYSLPGFKVYPTYDEITYDGEPYVILTYPKFNKVKNEEYEQDDNDSRINSLDKQLEPIHMNIYGKNKKILAMKKSEYEDMPKEDRYSTDWTIRENYGLAFGLMTIPFKLRPNTCIDTINFNLTTDITLGPYFGITKRVSETKEYYFTLPFTLGLSYININSHNTSNEEFDVSDGVVPGISFSTGLILDLQGFSIGVVTGKDWASGIGNAWAYNGDWWISFAIGYNFLSRE